MLVHQAFDKMLKHCAIAARELAELTGVSASRISQFRNGTFLSGKGSDLTTRSVNDLLRGAQQLNPSAIRVFCLLLLDKNPAFVDSPDAVTMVLNLSDWRSLIGSASHREVEEILLALADKYAAPEREKPLPSQVSC